MELYTTYTIKSRNAPNVWQFKYHLNGVLAEFKILDGILTDVQVKWLGLKFPFYEDQVKEWQKNLKDNFEIVIGEPSLSFDVLWEMYDNKVKKFQAQKFFDKLKEAEKIKCFLAVPAYLRYLTRTGVAKAHLSTFINQRYFDDEWHKAK
ncbi:hypothetical protein R1T16_17375 [Flavobacterium sp. DG1-102-2]|uniref:hypothetical protein n=1 Tax=Flavobacterium sp. DG1-102-2 TaxID=3081663 RepID=UPI00294922EB|nr:hypothetical protein [Flavobacterium sp. DG1-102-2]MDV6170211.1 hypothetical protein [Flavobacterium sp. DG1-102-2]